MSCFLYKLVPPRPTFPADMTEAEGAIMQEHFAYWSGLIAERKAVVYGPVMDPQGGYGIAVVEVASEASAQQIAVADPAVKAGAGFFSFAVHHMPDAQVRS